MFLRIYIDKLSANDADYLLRWFSKSGCDAKIAFGDGENHALLIKQEGYADDIIESVSTALQEKSFKVEIKS